VSTRQQLPPQIKKVEVLDRKLGRKVTRYRLTVDVGTVAGKRKQIRRHFTTAAEARAELAKVQQSVNAKTYTHTTGLTVDQACEQWLQSKHDLKPSTLQGHRVKLQALRAELGSVEVQKLTKGDIGGLIRRLRAGEVEGRKAWSSRSINYLLYLITTVLDDLVAQGGIITTNVARLVKRIAANPKRFNTLTMDQVFAILDHDSRDRHLWALALYGLRRGEISALRWEHVNLTDQTVGDLPTRSIRIVENRVAIGRVIITGSPKSKASNRTLPMPAEVIEVLKSARKRQLEERLSVGPGYGSGEYVAADELGMPYHPNLLTFRWGRMLDKLGIERVRLHDARHSCASLMHRRGVPIATIAAWLGHASAAFTMAVYTHSQTDALQAAATSFDRQLNPVVTRS
jgi:integrase